MNYFLQSPPLVFLRVSHEPLVPLLIVPANPVAIVTTINYMLN